ncbi:MAG: hypothetical protein DRP09_02035 [Candidatus Thorarchaeota archaeon]|nr:MAG: hypothetical protein DRP09_02035 [Candidatus Thorarchaeota archaeon]
MEEMGHRVKVSCLGVMILTSLILAGLHTTQVSAVAPEDLNEGPYLSSVTYKVIQDYDERVLALLSGEVDTDQSHVNPTDAATLSADPDISIYQTLRSGYGQLTINCRDYPLNISGLRRAFAFAFNKSRVISDFLDSYAVVHDSLVPAPNQFCIESDLPWHYYTAQVEIGNRILDNLGFAIDGGTGFRNTPDGSAFSITIEYPASSSELGEGIADIAVDAFSALHIDAVAVASDFIDLMSRISNHRDYDVAFYSMNLPEYDVEWLG